MDGLNVRWIVLGTGLVGAPLLAELRARGIDAIGLDHAAIDAAGGIGRAGTRARAGDVVVNAAAMANVDACEDREEEANRVNGEEPGILARHCRATGARLVHISTDTVLDATNVYARSKVLGERRVKEEMGEDALILRVSTVFGPHPTRSDFVKFVVNALRDKGLVDAASDMHSSPTYNLEIARAILAAIEGGARGTQAFVNEEDITRADFAHKIQKEWNAPGEVRAVPMDSIPFRAKRPRASTMPSTLGAWYTAKTLDDCLADYRARWK